MSLFSNESADVDNRQYLAAIEADKLQGQLIPDYPGSAKIASAADIHEAAIQIDLSRSLAAYYIGVVVWHQATAHDDLQGMEWFEEQKAQEHYERSKQIMSMIPDQPR